MNSIGEALRRERLRHNLSLEEVARETRINLKFLQAIEAEDFAKLPGGVFARSFVRQYARLVGLDEEEAAAEVQRRFQPAPEPATPEEQPAAAAPQEPQIELPRVKDWEGVRPRSGSSLAALGLVVVVMLVCSLVYVWWQQSRRAAPAPPPPQETAQVTTPQPAPAPQPQPAQEPAAASSEPSATPAAEGAERQGVAAETPAAAAPVAPSGAPVQVVLTAEEPTWISARSDGKFIYAGTLQPKESKGLEANEQVRIVVGNAGGVAVTLNGKPVPPLGPRGQVRTVQLSSGGVHIVPPKPPDSGSAPL